MGMHSNNRLNYRHATKNSKGLLKSSLPCAVLRKNKNFEIIDVIL